MSPTDAGNTSGGDVPPAAAGDTLIAALAAAVTRYRVRRVPLAELRIAFAHHDPTGAASSDSRTRLRAAIDELAAKGSVVLPKQKKLYEIHLAPGLPAWVERPAAPRPARPETPVRVWRPELAEAAALATTPAEFEVLRRVDTFLREDGRSRPSVPHRERSLELFGNEKRLDALIRTRLFTSEALTLDLMRCYQAPLPFTAQYVGHPDSNLQLLIVENHATYASALTAARERVAAGAKGFAVGWGAGSQLSKAIEGIFQLDPIPTAIWYFGDLDVDGLRIATEATAVAIAHGLPALRPAVPLYRALLHGMRQPANKTLDEATAWTATAWLGDDSLRSAAAVILVAGTRIAQESVGYETLTRCAIWW